MSKAYDPLREGALRELVTSDHLSRYDVVDLMSLEKMAHGQCDSPIVQTNAQRGLITGQGLFGREEDPFGEW